MIFLMIYFWPITLLLMAAYLYVVYRLFKKRAYIAYISMLLLPIIAIEGYQYYWFSKVIPEKIGISYPVSTSSEGGFREGCGTAVFKVSDETLESIDKDGLKFFSGVSQARGHVGESYYKYAEWKETPVPSSWASGGSWMLCSGLSHEKHSRIVTEAQQGGAYYTVKDEGKLILIPSLGYVVFSFFG